jgi:protein-S-isoprenylcysteine O-methyltransferase Ste14
MKELLEAIIYFYFGATMPLRVAYTFWAAFVGLYIYASYQDKYNSEPKERTQKKLNFSKLIVLLGVATLILFELAKIKKWTINQELYDAGDEIYFISFGIGLMLIGLFLVAAGRAAINGYWGPHIYIYKDKKHDVLVNYGIYKNIRHPIYMGQFVMASGTFVLSNSTIFLLFAVPLLAINIFRSIQEERHLLQVFGDKFITYKDNSYLLFPSIF